MENISQAAWEPEVNAPTEKELLWMMAADWVVIVDEQKEQDAKKQKTQVCKCPETGKLSNKVSWW